MSATKQDMTGLVFGKLTVLHEDGRAYNGCVLWMCKCACGNFTVRSSSVLRLGKAASCGCLARQTRFATKHGKTDTRIYNIWCGMVQRCTNPNKDTWKYYGGRGITVCERWQSFARFYEDMGDVPEGMSLERMDNDRGYEPSNCRWASRTEQMRNRSNTKMLTFEGRTQPLLAWAEEVDIPSRVIATRIYTHKWSVGRAITIPMVTKYRPKSVLGGDSDDD